MHAPRRRRDPLRDVRAGGGLGVLQVVVGFLARDVRRGVRERCWRGEARRVSRRPDRRPRGRGVVRGVGADRLRQRGADQGDGRQRRLVAGQPSRVEPNQRVLQPFLFCRMRLVGAPADALPQLRELVQRAARLGCQSSSNCCPRAGSVEGSLRLFYALRGAAGPAHFCRRLGR